MKIDKSLFLASLLSCLLLAGCVSSSSPSGVSTAGTADSGMKLTQDPKRSVPLGNQFTGQRFYNEKFMYWGFVRPVNESWGKTSRLVMLREKKPAPDRPPNGPRGRDDGSQYLLTGYYSGEIIYEPKSDLMLDVFVLEDYELISAENPAPNASIPFWTADRMYYRNAGTGPSRQGTKQGVRLHEDF